MIDQLFDWLACVTLVGIRAVRLRPGPSANRRLLGVGGATRTLILSLI